MQGESHMSLLKSVGAFIALWAVALPVFAAASLPTPKEFYFDEDELVARPIVVVDNLQGEALAAALLKERERGRKQIEATAQLAYIAVDEGRNDLGLQLYQQAINTANTTGWLARSLRWNYAWALYRSGSYEPALDQWSSVATYYGSPAWVPPTLALVLWQLGRKDEAVQWYAAAVRTEPTLWDNAANYPSLLPGWREQERNTLAEVLAAWQANPPSWP